MNSVKLEDIGISLVVLLAIFCIIKFTKINNTIKSAIIIVLLSGGIYLIYSGGIYKYITKDIEDVEDV